MPREFRHLVMTNIRRFAQGPREAECIARLLLMQVILVCVAHAAQKTWNAGRTACKDSGMDATPANNSTIPGAGIRICGQDPADTSDIPCQALWERIAGFGGPLFSPPAGTVFLADTGLRR